MRTSPLKSRIVLLSAISVVITTFCQELRAQGTRTFAFDGWDASLIGGYHLEDQFQNFEFQERRPFHEEEKGYSEEIEINTQGYIYHPLLVDFDVNLGIGLFQNRFETNTGQYDGTTDELFTRYDFSTDILQRRIVGTRIRLTKSISDLRSTFFANRLFHATSQSVTWNNKSLSRPTSASYTRNKRKSLGNYQIDELRRDLRVRNRMVGQQLSNLAEYRLQTLEEVTSRQDVVNHSIFLEQICKSSRQDPWQATFGERYYRQSGTVFSRSAAASMNTMSPTWNNANLSLDANFLQNKTREQVSVSRSSQISLFHGLFESVRSSIQGSVRDTQIGPGGTTTMSAIGNLNYQKKIPVGSFTLGFQGGHQLTDDVQPGRPIEVLDETHDAAFLEVIFLDQTNIDISSIVVMDQDGLQVFQEGIDYIVSGNEELVSIRIIPGGEIEEGQTLLFRYRYELNSSIKYSTNRTRSSLGLHLWRIWSLNASVQKTDESLIEGTGDRLNDRLEHFFGGSMRLGPSTTSVEYKQRREERTPLLTRSISQTFSFRLPARSQLTLRGGVTQTKFPDRQEESTTWSASAVYMTGPILATRWTLRSTYFNFDEISFKGEQTSFSLKWDTHIRTLEFTGDLSYFLNDTFLRGRDRSTRVEISVVRRIQ